MVVNNTKATEQKRFQNCLVCIFRPAFYFGYTGITAIKFDCDHTQRPVSFSLERSWLSTCIAIFLMAANGTCGTLNTYVLYGSHITGWDDFLLLGAIGIHFIAVYLFWVGISRTKTKIIELRGLAELVRDCEKAGFIIFDASFVKMAHYIVYAFVTLFVSLEVLTMSIFWLRGDFSLKAFRRLFTNNSVFMQGTVSTHFMLLQLVLLQLFQKILSEIKLTAENRVTSVEDEKLQTDSVLRRSFPSRIRYLHRLYQSAYLNFMEISNFVNPAFVFWWNIVIIDNIICAYAILNSILNHEPLAMDNLFFILLHTGTLGGLIIFLIVMGMLADVVSCLLLILLTSNQ